MYDEYGARWQVRGGDPASRVVNKLLRMQYVLVVLPFVTLATGAATEPAAEPEDIIRKTRLQDCLAAVEAA